MALATHTVMVFWAGRRDGGHELANQILGHPSNTAMLDAGTAGALWKDTVGLDSHVDEKTNAFLGRKEGGKHQDRMDVLCH